jgi:hypothetical protein
MITYTQISDMLTDFGTLYQRYDSDRDLYLLQPFKLMDWNTGEPLKHACNVTFNDARLFGDKIINLLVGSSMQTVVEGKELVLLPDKKTTMIEAFLDKGLFPAADQRLVDRGVATLKAFHSDIVCNRGTIATRCLVRADTGGFIPDLLPMDTRFLVYELDTDGLMWYSYNTDRSKARLKKDYNVDISGKSAEHNDVWDDENNYIYVERSHRKTQKHGLGYVPAVITKAPVGSSMQDKDSLKETGESIYCLARLLFAEKNRLGSILQTLNMMSFRGGLQYMSDAGVIAPGPTDDPRTMGGITSVEKAGGFSLVPINDIQEAAKLFYAVVDAAIQRGTLPAIDYGNLNFPLSGSAIGLLASAKDPIFLPRLETMGSHFSDLSKMAIKQYSDKKLTFELGDVWEKYVFTADDLKGDYDISFKFFAKATEDDVARHSTAAMAVEFLPLEDIMRDVLKLQDPQGTLRKKKSEIAELQNPILARYRQARAMAEEAEQETDPERKRGLEIEAQIQARSLMDILRQIQQGGAPASVPALEKRPRGQTPIPIAGQGASGVGRSYESPATRTPGAGG